jgi:hypothetical protein
MYAHTDKPSAPPEQLLAELAEATCKVASQSNFQGAFIDFELDLWYAHGAAHSRNTGRENRTLELASGRRAS